MKFKSGRIEDINAIAKKGEISEIQLYKYEIGKFIFSGSKDSIYYHNFEITFIHPSHINGPLNLQIDYDKEFTEEIPLIHLSWRTIHSESDRPLRAFRIKSSDGTFLEIAAEAFDINTDLVYHYPRENLKSNERLAYWVNQ